MKIYLFVSEPQSNVRAFTADETGANLPSDYAPWIASGRRPDDLADGGLDPVSVMVRRDGYFLTTGRISKKRVTH
jgi:hypothetical protein